MTTAISRIRCTWTGGSGLPGVSTFYVLDGGEATALTALGDFFDDINNALPTTVTVSVVGAGESIDADTGALLGGWTASGGSSRTGGTDPNFAAGTGAYVNWGTDDIVGGRRVKGRTFICPITTPNYDSDGTLQSVTQAAIQTAVNTLLGAVGFDLLIWHRPVAGLGGSVHPITSGVVPDRVTSLRSRRR